MDIFNISFCSKFPIFPISLSFENFAIISLEECADENLNETEIKWIAVSTPKYNMTLGGDGGQTHSITDEYRKSCSERTSGAGNPMFGKYGKDNPNFGPIRGSNSQISKALKNPCICDGVRFESIGLAETYFKEQGIPVSVRKRLDSKHHPSWYRLKNKRIYSFSSPVL